MTYSKNLNNFSSNIEQQFAPLVDTISKLNYQILQQSKLYFSLGHKNLASRLSKQLVSRPDNQINLLSPELLAELQQRLNQIIETDWQDSQKGVYPTEILFKNDWQNFFAHYLDTWLDLPGVWQRINGKQYQEFSPEINTEGYPSYYLQNFHHQTDGYLSDQSANLYDLQVDILFNGLADAMRRRILAPLQSKFTQNRENSPETLKILDVACGTGRTLQFLRASFADAALFGLDLSPAYLRKANQLLSDNPGELPQLIQGKAEDLPYQDNYFQGVTNVFTFHELPSTVRQEVIAESFRVLQPGGMFVICDSIQSLDNPQFQPMLENFSTMYHEPYYRDYLQDDLTEGLAKAGFENITTQEHFVSKYWFACKPVSSNPR